MATATTTLISAVVFEKMHFAERAELVRGEIIEMTNPGPAHGVVCVNIIKRLSQWTDSGHGGVVLSNDARILTSQNPDTVRGPDVFFVSKDRCPKEGFSDRSLTVPPDLVVEVLSPSDRWRDVHDKVNDYLSAGVQEVWVVQLKPKRVHVFRPDEAPAILPVEAELATPVLPDFRCSVNEFFTNL